MLALITVLMTNVQHGVGLWPFIIAASCRAPSVLGKPRAEYFSLKNLMSASQLPLCWKTQKWTLSGWDRTGRQLSAISVSLCPESSFKLKVIPPQNKEGLFIAEPPTPEHFMTVIWLCSSFPSPQRSDFNPSPCNLYQYIRSISLIVTTLDCTTAGKRKVAGKTEDGKGMNTVEGLIH